MHKFGYPLIFGCCLLLWGFIQLPNTPVMPPMELSAYGLFEGDMADQNPAKGIIPYSLNTPLFSDYAKKLRFIKVPEGKEVPYNAESVFEFPEGTIIAKTFYYPKDFRKPHKGRRLLETRILRHEADGWKAYPYIWNEAQTEANLEVAGGRIDISWIQPNGKKQKLEYVVPNMNDCKGCHSYDGAFKPIGPTARQLNGTFDYESETQNQLLKWKEVGLLVNLPELSKVPYTPVWDDPSTGNLDSRARAWLDINCAHCHNPHGPANTSGFYLDIQQTDPEALGVFKAPIAAGRGSGDREYDIHPGKPDESILMYRLESNDPGIRMPEVGRKMVHVEGVELIREWIRQME